MLDDQGARRKQAHESKAERGALGDVRVTDLVGTATITAVDEGACRAWRAHGGAKTTDLASLASERARGEIIRARLIRHATVGALLEITDVIERAILIPAARRRGVAGARLAAIVIDHVAIRAVDITDRTIAHGRFGALTDLATIGVLFEAILASEVTQHGRALWRLLALASRAAVFVSLEAVLTFDRGACVIRTDGLGAFARGAAVLVDEVLFTGDEARVILAGDGWANGRFLARASRAAVGACFKAVLAVKVAGDRLAHRATTCAFAKITAVLVLFIAILAVEAATEWFACWRRLARAGVTAILVDLLTELTAEVTALEIRALSATSITSCPGRVELNTEANSVRGAGVILAVDATDFGVAGVATARLVATLTGGVLSEEAAGHQQREAGKEHGARQGAKRRSKTRHGVSPGRKSGRNELVQHPSARAIPIRGPPHQDHTFPLSIQADEAKRGEGNGLNRCQTCEVCQRQCPKNSWPPFIFPR